MYLWTIALYVAAAGFLGGLASAYYIQNRSSLDEKQAIEVGASPTTTWEAVSTYLGNGLLGAIAGSATWASANGALEVTASDTLTFATLVSAFSVGLGGTKWLQSERDKGRWQAVTSAVAVRRPDPELQATLSLASSDQAVQIAKAGLGTGPGGARIPNQPRGPAASPGGGQGMPGMQQGRQGGQGGLGTPNQPRGRAAGSRGG